MGRALKSPGWQKDWHVGVRTTKSKKLVACITAIPVDLRIRSNTVKASEVNFLCIHKKLRSKRLAPTLIKEVTRRCNVLGVYQAIFTAGIVLPKPVTSCRYFHRPLDWTKLYEVGFSHLPTGSSIQRQVTKNHLPAQPSLKGLRPMEEKDVQGVQKLLMKYLQHYKLAPDFSVEEVNHWLLDKSPADDKVVWTWVIEDPTTHKITDFTSFYRLESSVLGNPKHDNVRAAYLYYYASETAFKDEKEWKERLNQLVLDTLILAKQVSVTVHVSRGRR